MPRYGGIASGLGAMNWFHVRGGGPVPSRVGSVACASVGAVSVDETERIEIHCSVGCGGSGDLDLHESLVVADYHIDLDDARRADWLDPDLETLAVC